LSALKQKVQTKSFTIQGSLEPVEFRKGKYAPLAQIYLESLDGKNRISILTIAEYKAKVAATYLRLQKMEKN